MELMSGSRVKGGFLLINGGFKLFFDDRDALGLSGHKTHTMVKKHAAKPPARLTDGSRSFMYTKLNLEKCFSS